MPPRGPKGLGETLAITSNALQTLMNVVTGASNREQIQGAIDQYHATIAARVPGFGQGQGPFTLAVPPGATGVDFSPYVVTAQGRVNEMLKRLGGGGQSEQRDAATSSATLEREARARGRRSTILTGPRGDLSTAPTFAPTLLGDVGYGKTRTGS